MSLPAFCFLVVVFGQTVPMDSELPGARLQLGPLQAPAASSVQEPNAVGLGVPSAPTEPSSAAEPDRASPPQRAIYGGQPEVAADSAPTLAPLQSESGTTEPAVLPSATLAESLLRESLASREGGSLSGDPVALKALLAPTTIGTRRLDEVTAYWRLAHTIAAYHYALDEQRFLMSLAAIGNRDDQPLLAAAQASAKAERAESRLAAIRAQQALAGIASLTQDARRPLPADPPFVGAYRTYFKELNERGAAANDLRQIDETLPVVHELIEAQAEAVVAAGTALNQIQRAHEQGQASLVQVLDAHQRLHRHRRDFLAAVEEYNGQIAHYALSVTVPAVSGERVVGMLIGTGRGHKSVLAAKGEGGQIQRVSGEQPVTDDNGGPVFREPRLESP